MSDTIVANQRLAAEAEHGLVVFLIGMRINRPWKVGRWLPVLRAMPTMLAELEREPALGLLHSRPLYGLRNLGVLQYWRSAADLRAYAHDPARTHLPAWQMFDRLIGTGGDVGIWHETYVVPPGHLEAIYVNMPRFGPRSRRRRGARDRSARHRRPAPAPRVPRPPVGLNRHRQMTPSATEADPARR